MEKSRKRQRGGTHSAAHGRAGFQQQYLQPCLLQRNCRCKPIGASTHNNRVIFTPTTHRLSRCLRAQRFPRKLQALGHLFYGIRPFGNRILKLNGCREFVA